MPTVTSTLSRNSPARSGPGHQPAVATGHVPGEEVQPDQPDAGVVDDRTNASTSASEGTATGTATRGSAAPNPAARRRQALVQEQLGEEMEQLTS